MVITVITYMLMGLVMSVLAIPLWREKIPPNSFYGFRTPKTLRDPQIWYPANAYTAKYLFWYGVVIMVSAGFLAVLPLDTGVYVGVMTVILLAGIVVMVVQGFRFLRKF